MSRTMKIVLGIVGALFILYLISSRTSNNETVTVVTVTPTVTEAPVYSNDEFKQGYMSECVGGEATYEYCSCTYDYLIDKYGLIEVARIGIEYEETGVIHDTMWEAVKHCM